MSRHALLIGVGKYLHGYQDLTGIVENDILRLHESLSLVGVPEIQRIGIPGQPVSYSDLKSAIATFLTSAQENSDLLIYYSGHGLISNGITYLVPSDAHRDLPNAVGYLVGLAFDDELAASAARSVCFVIDACRTVLDQGSVSGSQLLSAQATSAHPRSTIIYGSGAGEAARVSRTLGRSSLFTDAFARLITTASDGIPLTRLKEQLQTAISQQAQESGLDTVPTIDVIIGSDVDINQPFQFFAGRDVPIEGLRWATALESFAEELFDGNAEKLDKVTAVLDRHEAEAPKFSDMPALARWYDVTLPHRLAQASLLLLRRVKSTSNLIEKLLALGIAGVLEALVREREMAAASRLDRRLLSRLAIISPQLVDAYPTHSPENQALLVSWCDHILALRESIAGSDYLPSRIAELIAAVLGDRAGTRVTEVSYYLAGCLNQEFLGRDTGERVSKFPVELIPPTHAEGPLSVDGTKVAALVHLVWLLSADTRILAPELGLSLIQDEVSIEESLHSLGQVSWLDLGEVIDLRLLTKSAPLDQALRQLTTQITSTLISLNQPGQALHETKIPMAATATRLGPRDGAFRLPHIRFELSAAETHELLMGTNLYGNAQVAIRELYQNAIDACLYRQWRMRNASPEALADWTPEIVFSAGADGDGKWIECRDNGVGMSDYELRESFAKVGKRFRDLPEFLQETQDWGPGEAEGFRPISQFGIGVLSYFMIAGRVVVYTIRSDRYGELGDPLEVRISSTAGLFHLSRQRVIRPNGGGTIIRLYLRPEFTDITMSGALNAIIAAPTVATLLKSPEGITLKRWEPGCLYRSNGTAVESLAVPELGIYFHAGYGRVLINGIPLRTGPQRSLNGLTVSLDSRCDPRLRVDRASLLSLNFQVLRSMVVKASSRVANWEGASLTWLLGLFSTEPAAAKVAYDCLRNVDLLAGGAASHDDFPLDELSSVPGGRNISGPPMIVRTSQIGISVFDPDILGSTVEDNSAVSLRVSGDLDRLRSSARANPVIRERQRLLRRAGKRPRPGFPRFDDRLIMVFTKHPNGTLSRLTGPSAESMFPAPMESTGEAAFNVNVPTTLSAACDIAQQLKVSLGAIAIYFWAVNFLIKPQRLALTRGASGILASHDSKLALELGQNYLGRFQILVEYDREQDNKFLSLINVLPELPHDNDLSVIERLFNIGESERAILRAWLELSPAARAQIVHIIRDSSYLRELRANSVSSLETVTELLADSVGDDLRAEVIAFFKRFMKEALVARYATTRIRPEVTLSKAALIAVSESLDERSPWFTSSVPNIHITLAAANQGVSPDDVYRELASAGYILDPHDDWSLYAGFAELDSLELFGELFAVDEYGQYIVACDLEDLAEISSLVGVERIKQLAAAITRTGQAAGITERVARADLPRSSVMMRHSRFLAGKLPFRVDVVTLVGFAEAESLTLGEALSWLHRYRPLAEPLWSLPDSLAPDLADRNVLDTEKAFFIGTAPQSACAYNWPELAVRASAISGIPLGDIVESVHPLLTAACEDGDNVMNALVLGRDAVAFDDLLVLGTLQAWPDIPVREIVAACQPFCLYPTEIEGRAERLAAIDGTDFLGPPSLNLSRP